MPAKSSNRTLKMLWGKKAAEKQFFVCVKVEKVKHPISGLKHSDEFAIMRFYFSQTICVLSQRH